MNTKCEEIKDKIADFITGVLPETDSHALEQHLMDCSACRNYAEALQEEDIPASVIGEVVPPEEGMIVREEGESRSLEHLRVDPYWQAFEENYQKY